MAKKIQIVLTLQLPAGKATPAPPVGTALGPHGINIVEFTKSYNEKTADKSGQIIPAQITVYEDRSFSFILKTPPAADLLRKAAGIEKGSGTPEEGDDRPRDPRPGPRDREHQDGRPVGQRHRRGRQGHRGHRPFDGHRGRQARTSSPAPAGTPARVTPTRGQRVGEAGRPGRKERDMAHGKNYVEAAKLVDRTRLYAPDEAAQLAKDTTTVKFDATIEAHLRLGVDPRHADQMVRGTVVLPNGTGKVVRAAVFAQGEKAQEALRAGADEVGAEDLVKKIEAGWLEFDVALATPDLMGQVGRLGKILGRRGLMPNPKAGTITFDLDRAIREVKGGRVEFKVDKSAIVHVAVGKSSFEAPALVANLAALVDAINRAKPAGAKGTYLRTLSISSTMGPGIRVDIPGVLAAAAASDTAA